MNTYQVIGPPGCGKTTHLAKLARDVATQRGGERVLISSLTKSAAAEIGGRDTGVSGANVGTLHSFCYHAVGAPTIAESKIKEWNEEASPHLRLSTGKSDLENSAETIVISDVGGDERLALANIFRAQMIPKEEWPKAHTDGRLALEFFDLWQEWCNDNSYVDFTGLIEQAAERSYFPPNSADVLLFDECQDYSKLEMKVCRQWGEEAHSIVFVGDPDQCQPPDTLVETTKGQKQICALDPDVDRLLAYDKHDKAIYGKRNGGFRFKVSARPYSKELLNISAGDKSTTCTPNHKWWCKWTDEVRKSKDRVVYLMRQGTRFRVGHCQLFRSDGVFHPGTRAVGEKAEALWILGHFKTSEESYAYEATISAKFGIPQIPFQPVAKAKNITKSTIDGVFEALGDLTGHAQKCLDHHGLDISLPFKDASGKNWQRWSNLLKLPACNIIPGVMQVPVYLGHRTPEWNTVFVRKSEKHASFVYSLDVEKHHTYIADGLCTCNSIFAWRGADPGIFLNNPVPENNRRLLSQSYRVPNQVCRYATRWIRKIDDRIDVEYAPTAVEGVVESSDVSWRAPEWGGMIEAIEKAEENGESLMILATCEYMLRPTVSVLRSRGIPFHNPYRAKNGSWNPIKVGGEKAVTAYDRVLAFKSSASASSIDDIAPWIEALPAKILTRGTKAAVSRREAEFSYESVRGMFVQESDFNHAMSGSLEWFLDNVPAADQSKFAFPVAILEREQRRYEGGLTSQQYTEALTRKPSVIIGTCHSVKGGEADNVLLFPDISREAWRNSDDVGAWNGVLRTFYVGLTRARKSVSLGAYTRGSPSVDWLPVEAAREAA